MADATNRSHYFYQGDRLQAVQSGKHGVTFFRDAQRPLVQRKQDAEQGSILLCDEQHSVLQIADATDERIGYSPYGYTSRLPSPDGGLAFNGEFANPSMKAYLLGSYRLYEPVLMRFYSPDSESPFLNGGANAYGYCLGDPVNVRDPTGHVPLIKKSFNTVWRPGAGTHERAPDHGVPGVYKPLNNSPTKRSPITSDSMSVPSGIPREPFFPPQRLGVPLLPPGGLPQEVMYSVHHTQYDRTKAGLYRDGRQLLSMYKAKNINAKELEREFARLARVNFMIENKRAYSTANGYFYETLKGDILNKSFSSRSLDFASGIRRAAS